MKKVILIAACLFTLSVSVNAQEGTERSNPSKKEGHQKLTVEQRAQKNVDDLNAAVTLTDDQKAKVKTLATDRITKAEEIRTKYKGQPENKEAMQTELDVVRKAFRQNVKALLTPEQIEKAKAKTKANKAAKGGASAEESIINAND